MSDARAIPIAGLFRAAPSGPPVERLLAQREAAGLAAGRAEGAAALATARADWAEARAGLEARHRAELEAAAAGFSAAARSLEAALAELLPELALAIARKVLEAEPRVRVEPLASLVAEALAALPAGGGGTLHLAPELAVLLPAPEGWTLAADPALAPGEVRAELGASRVRASLLGRLDQLAALLAEAAA